MSIQFSFVCTNFYSERVVIIVGFLILVLEGTPKCDDDDDDLAKVKDGVMLKEEATSTVVSGMVCTPLTITIWCCTLLRSSARVCDIKCQEPLLFGSHSGMVFKASIRRRLGVQAVKNPGRQRHLTSRICVMRRNGIWAA
jgi:hypothetical protein